MKSIKYCVLGLVILACTMTTYRGQDLGDLTRIKINESLDKSTVLISVSGSGMDGIGSGFVATPDGWLVTNYHVVCDPQFNGSPILVKFKDGSVYPAQIIGTDRENDLAVLKITRPVTKSMTYLRFGNSDRVVVGQTVLAKGNPLGLEGTLSQGIVSAVRNIKSPTGGTIKGAIQTDAVIAQGNSGGPLVNALGEVIGVISGGAFNPKSGALVNNINFAVPVARAKELIDKIKFQGADTRLAGRNPDYPADTDSTSPSAQNVDPTWQDANPDHPDQPPPDQRVPLGRRASPSRSQRPVFTGGSRDPNLQIGSPSGSVGRSRTGGTLTAGGWAYLGLTGGDYSSGRLNGVKVMDVEPNSPAARAGLRSDNDPPPKNIQRRGSFQSTGHIITAIDGKKVENLDDLAAVLEDKYPGDAVSLTTVCCDESHEEKFKIRVGWALDTRSRSTNIARGPNSVINRSQDFGTGISVRVIGPDGKPVPPRSNPSPRSTPDPVTRQPRTITPDQRTATRPPGRIGRLAGREPYLGIEGDDYSANGLKGVKVAGVAPNSPAEIAGLRSDKEPVPRGLNCKLAGHIITAINGERVTSTEDLDRTLSRMSPGEIIDVSVVTCNGAVKETLPVKLSSR